MPNVAKKLTEYTALTVTWQKHAFLANWVREYRTEHNQTQTNNPITIMQAKQDVLATLALLMMRKRENRGHSTYLMKDISNNTIKEIAETLSSFGENKFDLGYDHEPRIKGLHV